MEFQEQTIKVIIDESKCAECESRPALRPAKPTPGGFWFLKDGGPRSRAIPSAWVRNAWRVNMSAGSGERGDQNRSAHTGAGRVS